MNYRLKVIPNAGEYKGGCGSPEHCASCELFEVVCPGNRGRCTTKKHTPQGCEQRECYGECDTCGGGPANPNCAPAICCKSPLKDIFLKVVRGSRKAGEETFDYTERPKIVHKTKGIVVTQGSVGSAFGNGYAFAPDIELVGVNLRHVWAARNGWWSRDMKDYLRVPKTAKLILLTSGYDDTLEKAWDAGLHEEDLTKVGFDYWQNLAFSVYSGDSSFQEYFMNLRSLRAVEASKSWFAMEMYHVGLMESWGRERMLEQVAKIPQICINMQFIGTKKSAILDAAVGLKSLHTMLPRHVTFWVHGPVRPHVIRLFKKICLGRDMYFLSSGPWIAGHKGQLLHSDGQFRTNPEMSRKDIVWENQRVYARLAAG